MSIKIKYRRTKNGMIAVEDIRALRSREVPYEYWCSETCCYRDCRRLIIKYRGSVRQLEVGEMYTPREFENLLAMVRESGEILHNMRVKPKFRATSHYVRI